MNLFPSLASLAFAASGTPSAQTDNSESIWLWIVFGVLVIVSLVIDLGAHKKDGSDTTKSAAIWSVVWIGLAIVFGFAVWPFIGAEHVSQYFTAYLLEKSLSVDNLFVFIVVFSFFKIDIHQQRRILFWGIMGAIVMRAVFIFLGVEALLHFKWLFYLFGAFLVVTGVKLLFSGDNDVKPEENFIYKFILKHFPVCDSDSTHFFHVENGKRMVTKLFVVLLVIETTDLMFAVDSIPAVLAVSQDMFVIYTSNIFAILGLRSLYFLLAGVMTQLRYLNVGLAVVLSFIGVKMILAGDGFSIPWTDIRFPGFGIHIPSTVSLVVVATILGIAIVASLVAQKRAPKPKKMTEEAPTRSPEKETDDSETSA
ncbi:MAG: TerC family protein [Myxococcales bacterium]|jgi:tellurite resistance protein TerC|nr:TerC family protein [Myxococcales bacterium]